MLIYRYRVANNEGPLKINRHDRKNKNTIKIPTDSTFKSTSLLKISVFIVLSIGFTNKLKKIVEKKNSKNPNFLKIKNWILMLNP